MNLKSMLTINIEMKLLSILLAAALWLLVAFEAVDEVEIPLEVSFVNTPPGLAVKTIPESERLIRIEGPRILLLRQKLKGVPFRFDLAGAGEGIMLFSGTESPVKLIQGVKMSKLASFKVELHR
jgi:hypothetical protein